MMTRRLAIVSLLAIVPGLAWVTPSEAGAPTDQLKQHVDQILQVLQDPALKSRPGERHGEIRKIAEDIFDLEDTARRALGQFWNARTPAERQEFTQLFAEVLDRAYISTIERYQGEQVRYGGESLDGDRATVKTTITTKSGAEIPIDYRMHLIDGRWRIYDVLVQGVSLVSNYRSQFNEILRTQSYQKLVERLKARIAQPATSPDADSRPAR